MRYIFCLLSKRVGVRFPSGCWHQFGRTTAQTISNCLPRRDGPSSIPGQSMWDLCWQNGSGTGFLSCTSTFLSAPFGSTPVFIPFTINSAYHNLCKWRGLWLSPRDEFLVHLSS
jgi:hypothetical protein